MPKVYDAPWIIKDMVYLLGSNGMANWEAIAIVAFI